VLSGCVRERERERGKKENEGASLLFTASPLSPPLFLSLPFSLFFPALIAFSLTMISSTTTKKVR
jgi:hypothetical protein